MHRVGRRGRDPIPIEQRFWEKVDTTASGCWLWTGHLNRDGYGKFWDGTYRESGGPRMVSAHVWAYSHFVGPIPAGLIIMHECDTPPCVNFEKCLSPGTKRDNTRDAAQKGRMRRGESHSKTTLTEDQVREIRDRYAQGGVFERELAELFGVPRSTINGILRRRTWKHL